MKCLYIVGLIALVESYEYNSFIRMSKIIKEIVYPDLKEECWVCTQLPPDSERGLTFTPWPLKDANFSKLAPKEEVVQNHPRQEREPLIVTAKTGEWCYERATFYSTYGMLAEKVGESTCRKYFNGERFAQQRDPLSSNKIRELTEIERTLDPTVPRKSIYWVCGVKAYRFLPPGWVGSCYPAWVTPPTAIFRKLPEGCIRNFRMAFATGRARRRYAYEPWKMAVVEMTKDISEALLQLSYEVEQIKNVTIQNRLALDLILSAQGGTCALIQQQCCVYVKDSSDIIRDKAIHLEQIADNLDRSFTMDTPPWMKTVADKIKIIFSWILDLWGWCKTVIQYGIIIVLVMIIVGLAMKCCACLKICLKLCNCRPKGEQESVRGIYQRRYSVSKESVV